MLILCDCFMLPPLSLFHLSLCAGEFQFCLRKSAALVEVGNSLRSQLQKGCPQMSASLKAKANEC